MASIFDAPKWGFLINPLDNLFQGFAEHARSPDFLIWRREPGFITTEHVFASAHFEWANNIHELMDTAVALKSVFDGAMFIEFGTRYEPPIFRRLINNSDQLTYDMRDGSVLASPFAQLTLHSAVPSILDPLSHFGPEQMVFLARYDAIALAMLKHLGFNGPDYRTLYSLLDWLTQHGWKDHTRIAAAADVSPREVKRFTVTVNNVEVLGPYARHGDKNWDPPARPMSLVDAQHLVLSAVREFLKERAQVVDLAGRWAYLEDDDGRL